MLNEGCFGVFFNDSSKILYNPKDKVFHYLARRKVEEEEKVQTFEARDTPPELQKKITLLHHFRGYLDNSKEQKSHEFITGPEEPVLVKKWLRTKHAIIFRLSNKIV